MNQYKVYVYAICKNEEKFVDRWMDSMGEADGVIVTDTGSEDATVERLRAKGAVVYEDVVSPWRFDVARNLSLDHVPEDADICVCTDLDELFEPGWRAHLEKAWTPEAQWGKYLYNWSLKEDGSPDVQMFYSKIHARHGFRWTCPVHECLDYIGDRPKTIVTIDGMVLNHYPDSTKSRGSYLPLLELAVKENPMGDRETHYLGREYMYKGEWQKCIDTLKRHLSLPSATWKEERCASMRWIAKAYQGLGNTKEAYAWYFRAISEMPGMREPYVECAEAAYLKSDWSMVFFMAEEALKIKEKSKNYISMGYAWDHTPHDLAAISCYWLGMYERSLSHAKAALEISPQNKRLQENLRQIAGKAAGSDTAKMG